MFIPNRQRSLVNVSLFVLLVLFVIIVTYVYVSSEHTFYAWDYAGYQKLTRATATAFIESPNNVLLTAIKTLYQAWRSTAEEFGDIIPTLPLLPFFLTFGDSRLVYILSIALVYLLPFALVLGAIAAKMIPLYPRSVYWSTALLTLLTPVAWAPTLRGLPDTGGALLMALAVLVYLQDLQLKHRRQIVLIGFFIAAAILFRRHFIYGSVAFFGAIILHTLLTAATGVQSRPKEARRELFKIGVRIGWMAAASLIALAVLGLPFIIRIATTNFNLRYTSYQVPFGEGLRYYGLAYGWVAWILVGLGFAVGIRTRVLNRPVATFIVLFGSESLLLWVLFAKQPNIHYTLHFTLFVVLGMAAFGWTAGRMLKASPRTLTLTISGIYLILNALVGLGSFDIVNNTFRPTEFRMSYSGDIAVTKLSGLFSANYPPLKRADYDEIVRLAKYLHTVAPAKPIYFAASSELFNSSTVDAAYTTLHEQKPLNILPSQHVDSADSYPLESLLQAQYVVLATPLQHHLRVQEQDVVKVVVDAFTKNWEIAQDFTRLPVQFALANGAVVDIYKRSRSTSLETALRTFTAMKNYIGTLPSQLNWISLTEVPGHKISHRPIRGSYFLETINQQAPATSFLYINTLPEQVRITGKLTHSGKSCGGASLRFDTINEQGSIINTTNFLHYPKNASEFTLPLQTKNSAYILFNISVDDKSSNHCSVTIEPLNVEGQ